jgi:hypothetical protein
MSDRLPRLDNTGIRLEFDTGRLLDQAEYSPSTARPYALPTPGSGPQHQEFTQRDDEGLTEWTHAARTAGVAAGVAAPRVFDELSALVCPGLLAFGSHTQSCI